MQLSVEHLNGQAVVKMVGEFDMGNKAELTRCLEQFDGPVVLDLSDVTFFDSSAVGVLVVQHRRLGGDLALRNPHRNVRRVLEVVGIGDWIEPG